MNSSNMNDLIKLISQMDKKDLQNAINQANEIMNSKDRDRIIENLKKNMK